MSRHLSPELTALITSIEAVLRPLRFRRRSVRHNGRWLFADWSNDVIYVAATIEPWEEWAEVYTARRSDDQAWRADIPIRDVLRAGGQPIVGVPDRVTADVKVIAAWADGMARSLGSIDALLRGDRPTSSTS